MTEDLIGKLFRESGLGSVILSVVSVPGGFLHRMYRVETENGAFAVKHLNPEVMRRSEAMDNFKRADALESRLEEAGIPIVPALTINGRKMQELDEAYFYVFRWQDGRITDWYHISAEQCRLAGQIQGRIHAIDPRQVAKTAPERSQIDWSRFAEEAARKNAGIGQLLQDNAALLDYAQDELNRARDALPGIECIVDEDMDPKNVMWDKGRPVVIDLECLERGNPVSSAVQLSLQWAGTTICDLDFEKLQSFFDGYLGVYDNGFRAYGAVFGLAYTWIEWLAYNVRRSLGQAADETERALGASEVRRTMAVIRYLREMEEPIKSFLRRLRG